jgi:hypothetical protein
MTEARDIRFRGTDPRLYGLAQALGLDLGPLNTRTLPDAVVAAIEAQGLPDNADARSLFADLLRNEAADWADRPDPAKLPKKEAAKRERLQTLTERKRARLHLLAEVLMGWALHVKLLPRHLQPKHQQEHGTHARGLKAVFAEVARQEGAQALTIKRWCMDDPEAKAMIWSLRPMKAPSGPHKPLRGLGRIRPLGDAGRALQDAWN